MADANEAAFRAVVDGDDALRHHLEPGRKRFLAVTGTELATTLAAVVSEADRNALSPQFANSLAIARRQATATGFDGWVDDLRAFVTPWGFELASIRVPVTVFPEDGHVSIVADRFAAVLASVAATS